jgi:hypothetical protein
MLTGISDYEEQRERASKALKLNGFDHDYHPRLLVASSTTTKPTIRIKD